MRSLPLWSMFVGSSNPSLTNPSCNPVRVSPRPVYQMFATIFFSIISFYAKQAFNYGSVRNERTARFLYHVRWVTFSAQVTCC